MPSRSRRAGLTVQGAADAAAALPSWETLADNLARLRGADVPEGMELFPLRVSGRTTNRVNVAVFGDGCAFFLKAPAPPSAGN